MDNELSGMQEQQMPVETNAIQEQQAAETPTETPAPAPTEVKEEGDNKEAKTIAAAGKMRVIVDPVSGKRSIKFDTPSNDTLEEKPEPTEGTDKPLESENKGTDSIDMGQQALEVPAPYTLDEFSAALANGRVDVNRVPQEYQAQYTDYRIKEAIQQRQAQQQAAYQRELAQRQQVEQQLSPENRVQANKDFYNALEEEASKLALNDLGLTQEQLDEAEFADNGEDTKREYQNAKDWHKQRLRAEMQARYQQEQAYKTQQQQVYADINSFVDAERAKEPNFDAIDARLATRYKTLPYEEGQQIQTALTALQNGTITQDGVQVIQNYYNNVRKEYYAEKNGLKPNVAKPAPKKPPLVENAGSGQTVSKPYKPNYSSLRNAKNSDDRKAWFSEYFKNKGW